MPIVKGLRRFTSNIVSSRRAVTEISNLVPGSNVQRSGRSSAAPFTSKRPIRKRVTTDDRKAMLESFVDKYRATNLGKFPSPTSALKEVGGSYYLIRKMLQEMEYNSKFSSTEKGLVKENKKPTKGKDTVKSSRSKEASSGQIVDQQLYKDALPESISNFDTNFELKEGLQPSTGSADTENSNITRDDTCNVATENQDISATNLGKFPSPTSAPKEVGLSFDALRKALQEMQYNSKFSSTEKGLVKENKKPTKGKDTVKSSRSKEASSGQIVDQQLYKDALPESISNFDTNFELKEGLQPSTGSADTENSNITRDDTCNVAAENQDISATNLGKFPSPTSAPKEVGLSFDALRKALQEMPYNSKFSSTEKGLVKENKKPTKGKDTVKSSRSKEASSGQIVDQQLYKDALPESISNFDTNFELKEGLQPSTGSADTENSNITRDDTCNVATENQDIRGLCREKPEHNVRDESPSEDHFDFNDSGPKVEQQHDGIRNVMRDKPESRKDNELTEKPSIWVNLKAMATGFINIWKKH